MELILVGFRECLLRTFSGVGTISLIHAKVDLSGLANVDLTVVEGETCSSDSSKSRTFPSGSEVTGKMNQWVKCGFFLEDSDDAKARLFGSTDVCLSVSKFRAYNASVISISFVNSGICAGAKLYELANVDLFVDESETCPFVFSNSRTFPSGSEVTRRRNQRDKNSFFFKNSDDAKANLLELAYVDVTVFINRAYNSVCSEGPTFLSGCEKTSRSTFVVSVSYFKSSPVLTFQ